MASDVSLILDIGVTVSGTGITANTMNDNNQIVEDLLNMTYIKHNMSPEEIESHYQLYPIASQQIYRQNIKSSSRRRPNL